MTEGIAVQTSRIATLTSVIRTRAEDAKRFFVHNGELDDLYKREDAVVRRLERIADQMEKNL